MSGMSEQFGADPQPKTKHWGVVLVPDWKEYTCAIDILAHSVKQKDERTLIVNGAIVKFDDNITDLKEKYDGV